MAGKLKVIEAQDNFKRVTKTIILNKKIDRFTVGLYATMLTLGEKWDLSVNGLAAYLEISYRRVQKSFGELEKHGYLKRIASKNDKGLFDGWDYEVYAEPTDYAKNGQSDKTDNPFDGLSDERTIRENGQSEKRIEITNRPNSKLIDLKKNKETKVGIRPTLEEVISYAKSRNSQSDPEAFFDYYESNGWVQNNGRPIKNWQAAFRNWERRDKEGIYKKTTPIKNTNITNDSVFGVNIL